MQHQDMDLADLTQNNSGYSQEQIKFTECLSAYVPTSEHRMMH